MRFSEVPLTILAGIVALVYMAGGNIEYLLLQAAMYCGGSIVVAIVLILTIVLIRR